MTKGTSEIVWKKANHPKTQCPQCQSGNIVRNGKKSNGPQHYLCKDCKHQFISDHKKTYRGCFSGIANLVTIMLVRGAGIRAICT
jgi:transposase-like protein